MDTTTERYYMGTPKSILDFTRSMCTRSGSNIRLYDIFPNRYINGAYHESCDDVWYPVQWGWDGHYGEGERALDLVNIIEDQLA